MNKKPCIHEYLAATESGKVLICRECGIVYLHMQNLSIRFEVEDFSQLADMLAEATQKIRAFPIIKPTPDSRW
jgi:hypothetical protein